MSPIAESRSHQLDQLRRGAEVLVIGGGITGAGVALDAASRGYGVGLVEQSDFASATSSRSTKLVHGGVRYLPQGHLGLVHQALRERRRLLRLAPHLVRPLPFLLPLYAGARRPLGLRLPSFALPLAPLGVRAGLIVYDLFARDPGLHHRAISRTQVTQEATDLRTDHLRAAFVYYDARTDDVRLTHAVLSAARSYGAATVNYCRVVDLVRRGGRIAGARIEDRLTGGVFEVEAKHVVNATGVWAQRVAALDGPVTFHLRHSLGTHVVLQPATVRTSLALVIPETDDGRIAFIIPWEDRFVLGTTDTPYDGDLDAPVASAEEVTYLLHHANRYLRRPLNPVDITSAYAGIRPLVAASEHATAALARDHHVVASRGGLISIIGGKLTTFRAMAEATVDAIDSREGTGRQCVTATRPLWDAASMADVELAVTNSALAHDQRTRLLESYGGAAGDLLALIQREPALAAPLIDGLPVSAAEIVYACRAEMAVSLTDCLFLRTRLAVLDPVAADRVAPSVAQLLARELGWDARDTAHQLEQYTKRRGRETAWASRPFASAAQDF
ncbi:MAG TPA: glycerol-3-phosphate dehydrogenase/oxidase [bacterium]|nr:glycerol-3-phosphate dehydrogenase/oxidase [bacterium]